MVNLLLPLIKMSTIIVKQGLVVIVALFIQKPCINDFESTVVSCEDCLRENKLPSWNPGGEAPSWWVILAIFLEKKPFLHHFAHFCSN